ncbi:MAG: periplasmic binding protein/LacI transcriptional regulator [Solirubrobacterales bacterium]|nr:periplasmic binding protein/LacI transcriptional regulator [Solirubrobacterales bacterium]
MRKSAAFAVTIPIFAALVVAGCGGGKKKPASTTAGTPTVAVQTAAVAAPAWLGSFDPTPGLGGQVPKKTIGFVNVLGSSGSAQRCQAEFEKAAKALGWTVKTADAAGDPAKMASDTSAMVTSGVDAIVNLAIEGPAAQQGLQAAKAKGIPAVSICGALSPTNLYQAVIAPNDNAVAAVSVRYMIDDLPAKAPVVAQFFSPIAALGRRDVIAKSMLADAGNKIVASHQVDFTNPVQDTVQSTLTMLRAHPEAKAVIVDQDFEFAPVVQAVKQNNLNVKVYGMYGEADASAALRKGGPARAFSQSDPEASAWVATDQLLKLFVNKKAIDPLAQYEHPFPVTLVTAGNVPKSDDNPFPDFGQLYTAQWKAEGYKF